MEHGRAERAPLSTGCDDAPQPCHVRGRIHRWRTCLRLSFHLPAYLICSDQLLSVDQTVLMSSTSAAARGQLWLLAHLAMPSLLLPLATWRCSQAVFTMVSSVFRFVWVIFKCLSFQTQPAFPPLIPLVFRRRILQHRGHIQLHLDRLAHRVAYLVPQPYWSCECCGYRCICCWTHCRERSNQRR
jgi:hypothetical protein